MKSSSKQIKHKFIKCLARRLVLLAGNFICFTFIGSMIIANDMALITFLPLVYFALSASGNEKYMAYLFFHGKSLF